MRSLSILVAEDVADFAQLLAQSLQGAGHTVTCVSNGRDAAALLPDQSFDLVVTDILMPVASGFDLIDEVKRLQPNARILAISGGGKLYNAESCVQAAEQIGADGVLLKPFGAEALLAAIEQIYAKPSRAS